MELVNVKDTINIKIDDERMVCSRQLHKFLGSNTRYNDWIMRRIGEYGFVQGVDFTLLKNEYNEIKELRTTINMAKELCMVEKTERGQQARRYFIDIEDKYRRERNKPLSILEMIRESAQQLIEQDKKINEMEKRIEFLEPGDDYFTVAAYARRSGIPIGRSLAQRLGKTCTGVCNDRGIKIEKIDDRRWGLVNTYPKEILQEVFNEYGSTQWTPL